MPIPVIDERVKYVGATALRGLNAKALRELKDVLVIQVDETPVAVVVPYDLYMRMQADIWPSSLLPAIEKFLSRVGGGELEPLPDYQSALAQEEDARAADLTVYEDDKASVILGPDAGGIVIPYSGEPIEHSMGSYIQPPDQDGDPFRLARTKSGHEYYRGEQHECGVADCPANTVVVQAIGTDNTPRGGKFARVDDSKPPVFDDIDEASEKKSLSQQINEAQMEYVMGVIESDPRIQGTCLHCGKISEKDLCSDCFLAGHREHCLICTEAK